MGHLQPVVDAANDQAFLASIEVEGLAQPDVQRNVGRDIDHLYLALMPGSNEVGDGRVTAVAGLMDSCATAGKLN